MSLQARMSSGDPRLYNPSRDVAHNFRDVVEIVALRLEKRPWAAINNSVTYVSDADLGRACEAYIKFMAEGFVNNRDPDTALKASGFYDVPEAAQVAYMAYLGTVITGIYFVGVKESTIGGDGPLSDVRSLVAAGDRVGTMLRMPRWRRRLAGIRFRLKAIFNAFKS